MLETTITPKSTHRVALELLIWVLIPITLFGAYGHATGGLTYFIPTSLFGASLGSLLGIARVQLHSTRSNNLPRDQ